MSVHLEEKKLPVVGMSCAACAVSVESRLNAAEGVERASVNISSNTAFVQYDPGIISLQKMQQEIRSLGYELLIDEAGAWQKAEKAEKQRLKLLQRKLLISSVCSLPVFVLSMAWHHGPWWINYFFLLLTIPVILYSGSEFYLMAWRQALNRLSSMDTLVALGTGSAFLFSMFNTLFPHVLLRNGLQPYVYYESAAIIITFVLAGRYLEERAKARSSSAIKKLVGLQPETVTILRNGIETDLPVHEVTVGEIFLLKPGEKVPLDGIVLSGESFVDESMINGEPMPVLKAFGAMIYAGTINQFGLLRARAEKVGSQTVLSRIIRLVEDAQASKAPVQRLVDKVAGIFVPVILIIAMVTFIVWLLAGPTPSLSYAFITTLSVLIIACPCALGLATPTALIAGIGRGAGMGILVKDAQTFEIACRADIVVMDKTGTITVGRPEVIEEWYANNFSSAELKRMILSIESHSTHPLANAIVKYIGLTTDRNAKFELENYAAEAGKGIKATISGQPYWIGNRLLLSEAGIEPTPATRELLDAWSERGHSIVVFFDKTTLLAAFALNDQLKPNTRQAIQSIEKIGKQVMLLSGDQYKSVEKIAIQAGIRNFRAEVMPEEKYRIIEELQTNGKIVAMIGDGINDSTALAKADVGMAIAAGSDIAMESAGITIMGSDPMNFVKALRLSQKTVSIIRQNLFWAFAYNVFAIPVAAGVLFPINGFMLNPMIAGAAMALSSIAVVTNSLRLRTIKLEYV